jgi:hypothetical protein
MNTPPEPPNFELLPTEQPSLAKLATIFAVAFTIAFGLCAASATVGMGVSEKAAGFFIMLSAAIEIISAVGLLTVAVIALTRAIKSHFTN